jgi:hypothetical protein
MYLQAETDDMTDQAEHPSDHTLDQANHLTLGSNVLNADDQPETLDGAGYRFDCKGIRIWIVSANLWRVVGSDWHLRRSIDR